MLFARTRFRTCATADRTLAALAAVFALLVATPLAGPLMAAEVPQAAAKAGDLPFLAGGDISLAAKIEEHGGVYRDGGAPRDLLEIFRCRGANCMRLRLFNSPRGEGAVCNDLAYTTKLGKRIKDAGQMLLLDFHYSDTWADPGHQQKPAAWKDLPFDDLERAVFEYTRDSIKAMAAGGARPDIVQVGNEITPGMIWPDGKLDKTPESWARLARLIKAGLRGVREAAGSGPPIRTMLHADTGGNRARTQWFFDHVKEQGAEFDLIGLSFYPVWHGTLDNLRENLVATAARYHKPIVVVETAYPWMAGDPKGDKWQGPDNKVRDKYPLTPEGQRQFLADLIKTVRETPDGLGCGVLWWAPEWIAVKGFDGHGATLALFDRDANALPALDLLRGGPAK